LKILPTVLEITSGCFSKQFDATIGEVTAIVLHEIGHAYQAYSLLGGYLYISYLLNEGVGIFLGTKPNKYKIEILSNAYWEKLDPDLAKTLMSDPTGESFRRAVLTDMKRNPRNHLSTGFNPGSNKRSEQSADHFAVVNGFGREKAMVLAKIDKHYGAGSYTRKRGAFIVAEVMKLFVVTTSVVAIPFFAITWPLLMLYVTVTPGLFNLGADVYDNPTERIQKIRRELIQQLKQQDLSTFERRSLTDDIDAIDIVLKGYNDYRTTVEVLAQFFFSSSRRGADLLRAEQQLERLMNNDIHLIAAKMKNLGS
jgi:hypothetical protein